MTAPPRNLKAGAAPGSIIVTPHVAAPWMGTQVTDYSRITATFPSRRNVGARSYTEPIVKRITAVLLLGLIASACNDVMEPEHGLVATKRERANSVVLDITMTELETLGGISAGSSLNDVGQVAGTSFANDGVLDVFLWQDGTMTGLGAGCAVGCSSV